MVGVVPVGCTTSKPSGEVAGWARNPAVSTEEFDLFPVLEIGVFAPVH